MMTKKMRDRLARALEDVAASILHDGFNPEYMAEGPTCFIGHISRLGWPPHAEDLIGDALAADARDAHISLSAYNLRRLCVTTPLAANFCVDLAAAVRAGCSPAF